MIRRIDNLNDRTVVLVLSHLTTRLRDEVPETERLAVQSANEAREALVALLESGGETAPASVLPDDQVNAEVARQALALMLEDDTTRPMAEALIEEPPDDEQRSLTVAITSAVVLGVLIGWLQTKMDIHVRRQRGKTEFDFKVKKDSAGKEIIVDAAKMVGRLIAG